MVSRHVMSVLPLKADIRQRDWHVRFVPKADIQPSAMPPDRQHFFDLESLFCA